jgi:hypothetical protein
MSFAFLVVVLVGCFGYFDYSIVSLVFQT